MSARPLLKTSANSWYSDGIPERSAGAVEADCTQSVPRKQQLLVELARLLRPAQATTSDRVAILQRIVAASDEEEVSTGESAHGRKADFRAAGDDTCCGARRA